MPTYKDIDLLSREELLDTRICDLKISLRHSLIEQRIQKLYLELENKGLHFKPHCWISDEWFSPDGIPGIAIPFYLFHPKLIALEKSMMNEVEGGNQKHFMQLLRHETGHAIDNAFHLRKNKKRQKLFGLTSIKYPKQYSPNLHSKEYVLHLNGHYAQAHPDEDWAETFATWLTPRSCWRTKYTNWPALEKISLVDEMMETLIGLKPLVNNRDIISPFREIKKTLRQFYIQKQRKYEQHQSKYFHRDLNQLFSSNTKANMTAVRFLRQHQRDICRDVSKSTNFETYTINSVMEEIIGICRKNRLKLKTGARVTKQEFTKKLIVKTKKHLSQPRFNKVIM